MSTVTVPAFFRGLQEMKGVGVEMLNDGVFRAGRYWPTLLIASTTAVTKASKSTLSPRNSKVSAKIEKKR